MTFCMKLKTMFQNIMKRFGFIAIDKYDALNTSLNATINECNQYIEIARNLKNQLEDVAVLNLTSLRDQNAQLMKTNDKLLKDMNQAKEYYREVQTQVSNYMHSDKDFRFTGATPIPGASKITTCFANTDIKDNRITAYGRTIFLDEVTAKIDNAQSISDKYHIAINTLIKLGLMEKLVLSLVNSGAIQFTLAYNDNCTTNEVYYKITADCPKDVFIVVKSEEEEG